MPAWVPATRGFISPCDKFISPLCEIGMSKLRLRLRLRLPYTISHHTPTPYHTNTHHITSHHIPIMSQNDVEVALPYTMPDSTVSGTTRSIQNLPKSHSRWTYDRVSPEDVNRIQLVGKWASRWVDGRGSRTKYEDVKKIKIKIKCWLTG